MQLLLCSNVMTIHSILADSKHSPFVDSVIKGQKVNFGVEEIVYCLSCLSIFKKKIEDALDQWFIINFCPFDCKPPKMFMSQNFQIIRSHQMVFILLQ